MCLILDVVYLVRIHYDLYMYRVIDMLIYSWYFCQSYRKSEVHIYVKAIVYSKHTVHTQFSDTVDYLTTPLY